MKHSMLQEGPDPDLEFGGILFKECQFIECMTMEWMLPGPVLLLLFEGTWMICAGHQYFRVVVMRDKAVSQYHRENEQQELRYALLLFHPSHSLKRKYR